MSKQNILINREFGDFKICIKLYGFRHSIQYRPCANHDSSYFSDPGQGAEVDDIEIDIFYSKNKINLPEEFIDWYLDKYYESIIEEAEKKY